MRAHRFYKHFAPDGAKSFIANSSKASVPNDSSTP